MAQLKFPNINSTTLTGRCTRDPELKFTQSNIAVMQIDIAFNRNFKKNNEWVQSTSYIQITVWRDLAEKLAKEIRKGSPVFVEGYLEMEEYQNRENQKVQKMKLVASKVHILEKDDSNYNQVESSDNDEMI